MPRCQEAEGQHNEWTVFGRLAVVPPFFIAYVLMGWLPAIMVMFAAIDVIGALWTRAALKITEPVLASGAAMIAKPQEPVGVKNGYAV